MNDVIDTDARCETTVSVFIMNIEKIKQMRSKHIILDHALLKQEVKMLNPNAREPALDYIIRDPYS